MKINLKKSLFLLILLVVCGQIFAVKPPKPTLVEFETTEGKIKVMLYDDTPQHRDNFVKLVREGFYDGLLFHRVIGEFMAQAGDPNSRECDSTTRLGSGGLDYTIPAEFLPNHYHKRGALAAARLGDVANPERASSACQFYLVQGRKQTEQSLSELEKRINSQRVNEQPFRFSDEQRIQYKMFGGTPFLDMQYTVFGEIVAGFDVLDRICAAKTNEADRPLTDIRIVRARIVKR